MKRKLTALLLIAAQLAMFSCGDNSNVDTETTTDTQSETTEVGDGYSVSKTFEGQEVNILLWSLTGINVTEETGDVINDAVYHRNLNVEDELKIKLKYDVRAGHGGDYGNWISTLNASIMAGDNAYQLAGGYGYRLTGDSLNDSYMNLKDNPYIDFTKPWWPSNIIEASDLGGRMTVAFGNIDPSYYNTTYDVCFNKQIAEDLKFDDIYTIVKDGKWTLDKLIEYSKLAAADLDGDTKMTDADRYGLICDNNMCVDAFINSCDIKITEKDSNGVPSLIGLTERYTNLYDKLYDFLKTSDSAYLCDDMDNVNVKLFMSGKSMFFASRFRDIHTLRSMDDDFGVVPYPKYDEAQEEYYTYNAIGNSTSFIAPVTADEELTGCLLEALAYHGYKEILPEYYERALKGKGTRDDSSAEMLDIIFNNVKYDFTQIYSFNFGDQKAPSMALRMSLKNSNPISSLWASNQNIYDETMEKLTSTLK